MQGRLREIGRYRTTLADNAFVPSAWHAIFWALQIFPLKANIGNNIHRHTVLSLEEIQVHFNGI